MKKFTLLLLFLAFLPLQAHAKTMMPADAEKLKSSFQGLLDYQKSVNEAFGGVRVVYEGELTVTPQDSFYAVTFPRILIKNPIVKDAEGNIVSEDSTFDMGVITMNTMPDDKDGYWKIVMTLPQKMTLTEAEEGKEDFSMQFANQNAIGVYSTNLGLFTKINLSLSDIKFTSNGKDTGINVGSFQLFNNSEEQADGKFSGPGHLTLSNLVIAPPDEQDTPISFGELKVDYSIKDVVLPKLSDYQDKLIKLAESINQDAPPAQGDSKKIMDSILNLYDFDFDGLSFAYSLKDMSITVDPLNEKKYETFKLDSAALGLALDGVKSEKGNLRLTQSLSGFNISPPQEEIIDILPDKTNMNISFENVPFGSLFDVAKTSATSIAENPDSAQMVGLGLLMRMPALLSASGTKLSVKDSGLNNSIYDVNMNGEVLTDLTSMTGFVANFKTVFQGLDALINVVENRPVKARKDITLLGQTLAKIKKAGKVGTADNGKPAYIYDFEATKDGKFLLNGADPKSTLQ